MLAIMREAPSTPLRTWSRRAALIGLAGSGLSFALFGPRPAKERTDGRIVLDYWEKWTGLEGRAMQQIVADFNASQDRIFVRYFATAGIDEKSQIAIAGGSPPDILGLWNYNLPAFAEPGAILPLDDLGPRFNVTPSIYTPGMAEATTHKGRHYAAVNTGGTVALYYNKAHFREVGLPPPRTIEELDAANRAHTRLERGRITRMGFHHREPGWWVFLWGYMFGGSLYDPAANRATLATPENIQGYEWVRSYPREFGLQRVNDFRSTFGNYDSPLNPFLSGKLSMVIQGPWLANMINLYAPSLEYGVVPLPVAQSIHQPQAPIGLVDTDILVIPRGVRHPEASMEFIAYTQQQPITEQLATVHCKPSPLATSSEGFTANHPNTGVKVFDDIARSPRAFLVPKTRAWIQVRDELIWVFDQSWNDKGEPKDLLAAAQQRIQRALDAFADRERRLRASGASSGGGAA